ncbi:MAG: hypothetical protein RJA57_1389 [Bacteroidota bacterium]|jgi:signal transduction histidine kinase
MSGLKKWKRITFLYWMLLVYIVAALVWWYLSLESQNRHLSDQQRTILEMNRGRMEPAAFDRTDAAIREEQRRNTAKYTSEGITFLILTLIGALFVYRAVRRQFSLQQQQQNFMMAVTHELKTPLSVARLNLETLQKYQLDPEKQKKLIRNTLDETTRLNFLTNNILIASQLEGGRYHATLEELDLTELLRDSLQDFRRRFPDRRFEEDIEPDTEVRGDTLLLQILLSNLLENAVKYSPKDRPVTARLHRKGARIRLSISDEGPGVPNSEKQRIFQRFYRIGNEATRTKPGTGLGLYLCRIIATDHEADICVTDHDPAGSTFVVTFRS